MHKIEYSSPAVDQLGPACARGSSCPRPTVKVETCKLQCQSPVFLRIDHKTSIFAYSYWSSTFPPNRKFRLFGQTEKNVRTLFKIMKPGWLTIGEASQFSVPAGR